MVPNMVGIIHQQWQTRIWCSGFYWTYLVGKRNVTIVIEGNLKVVRSLNFLTALILRHFDIQCLMIIFLNEKLINTEGSYHLMWYYNRIDNVSSRSIMFSFGLKPFLVISCQILFIHIWNIKDLVWFGFMAYRPL